MPFPDALPEAVRHQARNLYWLGWIPRQIAEQLGVSASAVRSWKQAEDWDKFRPIDRVEDAIEGRLLQLIAKDPKDGQDFKEIDLLSRQLERTARVKKYAETGRESDINPNIKLRSEAPQKPRKKNQLDKKLADRLDDAFREDLFAYQEGWREAGLKYRIRNILKSRQIGGTRFFAREAIVDAARTRKNKIFLSASRAQAYVFKEYIRSFVQEVCDVDLTGDPIILSNQAALYFLGTNTRTAQSYHGDVVVDEYWWIQRFLEFRKVVSGMAMHKKWSLTYLSTPSTTTHEAHSFWSGELFNKRRPKGERVEFDTDHKALAAGALCPDGQWRQIVTVEDAIAGGCDLFDIDQLLREYSPEEFRNLLMCEPADDTLSAFPLELQQPCLVDSWEAWDDVKPFSLRPVGDDPVWVGYDPSGDGEDGDGAGVVVSLPPKKPGGLHRLLERHRLLGHDYEEQGAFILGFLDRYNVEHIGIDVTGLGEAVAKVVEKKFPLVTRHLYTALLKMQMVLQCLHLMRRGRLQWDAGWSDLAQSFMAIRRDMTAAGGAATYTAGRNKKTGHSELAWAAMHALHHEPIEASADDDGGAFVEICG